MTVKAFVSMILPIRNEAAYIERCLQAIFAQDYPGNQLEILIVDGDSIDDTKAKIQRAVAAGNSGIRVTVLDNPKRFMPAGFNLGLRHAQGDIIIMLGGHTEIAADYASKCARLLLENQEIDCVGGAMDTKASDQVSEAIALAMSSKFGVGNVSFRTHAPQPILADTAVFGAYRRAVFERLGGLDEELIRNQDDEFNYRLREHGGKILYYPGIRSTYYSRASLSSLWRQYFQYGMYKVRVWQKHPRQMSLRQFVPAAFVLAMFISAILFVFACRLPQNGILLFLSLLTPAAYALANFSFSLYTAAKNGWTPLPLLPFVFAALHFSYGTGFLAGLVKFWNRWNDKTGRMSSP